MTEQRCSRRLRWIGLGLALAVLSVPIRSLVSADAPKRLDPAAWGDDHVGQPVPEYAIGDECLFCHRDKVGPTWGVNRHNLTIRMIDEKSPALAALKQSPAGNLADEIKLVMGDQRRQRFLKPAKAYGKLDLLSVEWVPPQGEKPGKLESLERPHWDATHFADSCAGCHTTAVDPKEKAFSALSLDCFVCHGNIPAEHTKKPEAALLSPRRKDEARVVTSICGQCHIRMGHSRATGRPYPTNFVPGDNLFRDFRVDFSEEGPKQLSAADQHVIENVRDVVVFGKDDMACLSCHDIHGRSSKKHQLVRKSDYCFTCHAAEGLRRERKPFSAHSKTCGY
jgi:predicted CXXCH cytochrome family protein